MYKLIIFFITMVFQTKQPTKKTIAKTLKNMTYVSFARDDEAGIEIFLR